MAKEKYTALNLPLKVVTLLFIIALVSCHKEKSAQTIRQVVLQEQLQNLLTKVTNKSLAILTNPTSIDSQMKPLFERILQNSKKYNITVKCFFAPQHGLRGDRQDGAGDIDYIDQQTGIQVYSLYGVRRAPTPAELVNVDMLLYDIQDVGCRFYTFMWTLTYTMESLNKSNTQLIVFDRPNPLGRKVQGCPLNFDSSSVGRLLPGQAFTIPQRYGLTIGEFVRYISPYLPIVKTTIITMKQVYDIHDNQWVLSSPNMPTLQTVRVYPGMGLIEGTSMSQGRGTTKPFQITGNPKINPMNVTDYFARKNITSDSYYLRQTYFIPTFSKHQGQVCGGVQIHISDYQKYDSVQTAMLILRAYLQSSVGLNVTVSSGVDRIFGRIGFSQQIQNFNIPVREILDDCKGDLNVYKVQYQKYWIYKDGIRLNEFSGLMELNRQNQDMYEGKIENSDKIKKEELNSKNRQNSHNLKIQLTY